MISKEKHPKSHILYASLKVEIKFVFFRLFLELICKCSRCSCIAHAIDGLEDIYEKIRKKSDFKILDKNLRALSKITKNTGTDVMLNMVVTKENYILMPLLIKYAKEINIKYMDFTLFNLASVTDIEQSYYTFYQSEDFQKTTKELEQTIKNTPEVLVTERNFKTDNSF